MSTALKLTGCWDETVTHRGGRSTATLYLKQISYTEWVVATSLIFWKLQMRTVLYGKKAANLYTQAFVQNTQARALYQESEDTYYRANDAASYDDWRRARHQWDYFYNRH